MTSLWSKLGNHEMKIKISALIIALLFLFQCSGKNSTSPVEHECGSGNINLNEYAYEIADAVVFSNYFIYGYAAFTTDSAQQAQATDVNCDGILCGLADFVYIVRVIVGDELSEPKTIPTDTANFQLYGGMMTVDKDLGAALFVFDGLADISLAGDARIMEIKTGYVDGFTRVLVYSFGLNDTMTGDILNVSGGSLVSIEAVDYYGTPLVANFIPFSPTIYNYPNPFYPTTTFAINLPERTEFSIKIYDPFGGLVDKIDSSWVGSLYIEWNAGNLSDGVYLLILDTQDNEIRKTITVLRQK